MVITDVGQNNIEEINFVPAGTGAGVNYGWRCFEGSTSFTTSTTNPCMSCTAAGCPKVFPVYEYTHTSGRCSITGGYVYRGCDIPDLQGTYFFADYCSNEIWSGKFQGGQLVNVTLRSGQLAPGGGLSINSITSFGEDARGELYICDQGGEIFKIVAGAPVQQADMPALRARIALGDTIGSSAPGNALLPGIVPFADAGSRIRGVGYLRDAKIRDCASVSGQCLSSAMRLDPFDIDLDACVDSMSGTLTRQFVFTNTGPSARALVYVDVLTPSLRGDPDQALKTSAAERAGARCWRSTTPAPRIAGSRTRAWGAPASRTPRTWTPRRSSWPGTPSISRFKAGTRRGRNRWGWPWALTSAWSRRVGRARSRSLPRTRPPSRREWTPVRRRSRRSSFSSVAPCRSGRTCGWRSGCLNRR